MKKFLDKNAIGFGVGAVIGAIVVNMFIAPKLPSSLGGGA